MPTFAKIFSDIVSSSLWCEDSDTRVVFVTMLATCDAEGRVYGAVPGLARIANVPVSSCRRALDCLQSPDPDSRTKDFEGRRVAPIEGGWQILNYIKHRDRQAFSVSSDPRHVRKRAWQRQYREEKRQSELNIPLQDEQVHVDNKSPRGQEEVHGCPPYVYASPGEGDSGDQGKKNKARPTDQQEVESFCIEAGLQKEDGAYFWNKWEGNGYTNGGRAIRSWKAVIRSWKAGGYCPSQKQCQHAASNRAMSVSEMKTSLEAMRSERGKIETPNLNDGQAWERFRTTEKGKRYKQLTEGIKELRRRIADAGMKP